MERKIKNAGHLLIALGVNVFYGFPAKKLKVIGVTGTDGKTTTASMIYHILKESGKSVSCLTTLGAFMANGEALETGLHTTTPSSLHLQRYLKKMVVSKSEYVVLEVTSHALDQNRVRGINFEIGVFTNISHEHLDYHKTIDSYFASKLKLLANSKVCVVNLDDKFFSSIRSRLPKHKLISFSLNNKDADVSLKSVGFTLPFDSSFNNKNALAAIAVAQELGVSRDKIKKALKTYVFPEGRQEVIYQNDFRVIVDFAHTPNAFAEILPQMKKITKGRLIHVFGAAGKRDALKRPQMGKISSQYADVIYLTAEDPRGEKVSKINAEIRSGVEKKAQIFEIESRKEAIEKAILTARKGDTVIVTGKGHEKSMNLGNGEMPWSDRNAILDVLNSHS